jgi:hypothetical protein
MSARRVSETHARIVSRITAKIVPVAILTNNAVFVKMEAFKDSVGQAGGTAKEISRIVVSAARSFEPTARNRAADRRDIHRYLCITSTIKHLAIRFYIITMPSLRSTIVNDYESS